MDKWEQIMPTSIKYCLRIRDLDAKMVAYIRNVSSHTSQELYNKLGLDVNSFLADHIFEEFVRLRCLELREDAKHEKTCSILLDYIESADDAGWVDDVIDEIHDNMLGL